MGAVGVKALVRPFFYYATTIATQNQEATLIYQQH